jgi:hypothetical protein
MPNAIKATAFCRVVHELKLRLHAKIKACVGTGPGFFRREFEAAKRRLRQRR